MGLPEDLAFRMFGYSFGAWFWIDNAESFDPNKLIPWHGHPGKHPFVLVADYTGGPVATVRPRSTSSHGGIRHNAHPAGHVSGCKIQEKGWIVPLLWSLGPGAICAENYSCVEPYEEILGRLMMEREE